MPYITDPETGQQVWSGTAVPASNTTRFLAAIAALGSRLDVQEGDTIFKVTEVTLTGSSYAITHPGDQNLLHAVVVDVGSEESPAVSLPLISTVRAGCFYLIASSLPATVEIALVVTNATGSTEYRSFIAGPAREVWTILQSDGTDWVEVSFRDNPVNLDANSNFRAGVSALDSLASGSHNIGMGLNAATAVTSGSDNLVFGKDALKSATSASDNVVIGERAATAATALSASVVIGDAALLAATSPGTFLTIVGRGAATTNSPGNQSVLLGAFTEVQNNGDTNEIVIGYNVTGNGSNSVTIGNSSITSTYLRGIRATLPVVFPSYAKASLPTASSYTGGMIYVTDDTGGGTPAFSDGTNWRRTADRNVIS